MWCHFGQRLERPGFVQAVLPGARGHQDELYSYVVIRRGPRVQVGEEYRDYLSRLRQKRALLSISLA